MKRFVGDPLSEANLKQMLKLASEGANTKIKTREGTQVEFKESFNFASLALYIRTMAAFANARGGYIFFGITDKPRKLKGLAGAHLSQFDDLDRAKLTDGLNEHFSPEIQWDAGLFKLAGKTLGAIYVYESERKPVVAKKTFQIDSRKNVQEGDILYRYNSRSEKIKFPELNRLIIDSREREAKALLDHFRTVIEAGASNAVILDLSQSEARGPNGQQILLDEELVESINFIREGEFNEKEGAPALKLVGEIAPAHKVALTADTILYSAITAEDVIEHFLEQDPTKSPESFIRAVAAGTSAFLPIHFYRKNAGWSVAHTINEVQQDRAHRAAKTKLIERLESGDTMETPPPSPLSTHKSSKAKIAYLDQLKRQDQTLIGVPTAKEARWLLEAIRSLSDTEIRGSFDYLCNVISDCFDTYYAAEKDLADPLRRACCRIDFAQFGSEP